MKLLCTISIILFSITSLFSQEFIKQSTIHFKDSSTAKGDFYYYISVMADVSGNKNSPYVGISESGKAVITPIFKAGIQVPLFQGKRNRFCFYRYRKISSAWLSTTSLSSMLSYKKPSCCMVCAKANKWL